MRPRIAGILALGLATGVVAEGGPDWQYWPGWKQKGALERHGLRVIPVWRHALELRSYIRKGLARKPAFLLSPDGGLLPMRGNLAEVDGKYEFDPYEGEVPYATLQFPDLNDLPPGIEEKREFLVVLGKGAPDKVRWYAPRKVQDPGPGHRCPWPEDEGWNLRRKAWYAVEEVGIRTEHVDWGTGPPELTWALENRWRIWLRDFRRDGCDLVSRTDVNEAEKHFGIPGELLGVLKVGEEHWMFFPVGFYESSGRLAVPWTPGKPLDRSRTRLF